MSDETLITHCSPTLAGIKTGNLFSCACRSKQETVDEIRKFNKRLAPKGLCMIPLKFFKTKVLVYLFRPDKLDCDLTDENAVRILSEEGYTHLGRSRCLSELMRRLNETDEFPHEIGLFLSYPPEDVRGFIVNNAASYKYSGTWKVYGDADTAKRTFDSYRRCEAVYKKRWLGGSTLEELTIPSRKAVMRAAAN